MHQYLERGVGGRAAEGSSVGEHTGAAVVSVEYNRQLFYFNFFFAPTGALMNGDDVLVYIRPHFQIFTQPIGAIGVTRVNLGAHWRAL